MEGEAMDEKHFLLQKLESVQILFLWTLVAFCPHLILINKPCLANIAAKIETWLGRSTAVSWWEMHKKWGHSQDFWVLLSAAFFTWNLDAP